MCKWGDTKKLLVTIPADLSHTGKEHKAIKRIDKCIFGIVKALNKAGYITRSSCCGHGEHGAEIILANGDLLKLGFPIKKMTPAQKKERHYADLRKEMGTDD